MHYEIDGDISELYKSDFPHSMNTREYQDYCGEFPPISMYSLDGMSSSDKQSFIEWQQSKIGEIFDFQKEILNYCRLDVTILRLACLKFRKLIMDISTVQSDDGIVLGVVDVFAHVTIASACMQIYKVNFMEEYYDVTLCDGRNGEVVLKGG